MLDEMLNDEDDAKSQRVMQAMLHRKVTGIDFDGGYSEYTIAPAAALAAIPDDLPAEEAGPFMCADVSARIITLIRVPTMRSGNCKNMVARA